MIVCIAGGRDIKDYHAVEVAVTLFEHTTGHLISEIVSGMAPGVDSLAVEFGRINRLPVKPFYADWSQFGKSAGPLRNAAMAQYADALILVWDGESKGSANCKSQFLAMKKPVYEQIVKSPAKQPRIQPR